MPLQDLSFFAHQGNHAQPLLARLFTEIRANHPGWRIGFVTGLSRYTPSTSENLLTDVDPLVTYALADPETHRLAEPFPERGRGRQYLDYLQESDPRSNRDRFVTNVLRAQVNAQRDILISPWLVHGSTASQRDLRASLLFAELAAAHPLATGRTLLLGIAATEEIVADATDRGDLLDALVDLADRPFYFRMRVTPPTSYAQYANRDALSGLRELVTALNANGRRSFLPQMGLAGWLMLPFGAIAFGSGTTASLQRFVAPSSGFGQPLEWYFMPELLGFVLRHEAAILRNRLGWEICECPYCGVLNFTGGLWDRDRAGLHYLWWCARLTNELVGHADPETEVREVIAEAQDRWSAVQATNILLDPRSEPTHLGVWSAVVA